MSNRISTTYRWSVLLVGLLATLGGCASQGPPERARLMGPDKRISGDADAVSDILIEIPVGSVNVIAVPGSRVNGSMEVRCDARSSRCARLAEEVHLELQVFQNRMILSPSTQSKFAFRNADVRYRIELPENTPVRIDMGYGSLSVKGLRSDLTVDMSAGEVSVEAPREVVRRVWADANFGDASLKGTDTGREGERRLLVGAEADWREGSGQHDIVIDLNAGDISVRLTPP